MLISIRKIYCPLNVICAVLMIMTVPPLTQAQSNGALPDVLGISPGMPIGEAYRLLKAHDPKGTIRYGQKHVEEMSGKLITHQLLYSPTGSGQDPEIIAVDITVPPSQQTVWRVSRYLRFEPGKEPVPATLLTALRQKYGQDVRSTMPQNAYWVFDRQGHPANRSAGFDVSDCAMNVDRPTLPGIMDNTVGGDNAPLVPLRVLVMQSVIGANRDACHALVYVSAVLSWEGLNTSLVRGITTTVTDIEVLERSQLAANALLQNGAVAQQQRVMKNAKQQPAPVF